MRTLHIHVSVSFGEKFVNFLLESVAEFSFLDFIAN